MQDIRNTYITLKIHCKECGRPVGGKRDISANNSFAYCLYCDRRGDLPNNLEV